MKTSHLLTAIGVIPAMLLAGCAPRVEVGALRTESKSVELGDARSVRVEIDLGAGDLEVTGGADKLLEAGFTYNVARLRPEVDYADGKLVVRQPDIGGLPDLRGVAGYRNEWGLRLADGVPMDLTMDLGAGAGNVKLAGLSLTGLDVRLGAGTYTIDLSGDWARDLDVTVNTGAANVSLRLPRDVGARVQVQGGLSAVEAGGLARQGNVYTNAAYGVSGVTMQVNMQGGVGQITLEVDDAAATTGPSSTP